MAETPNRSAGRIEDELWQVFLAFARQQGMSNTDAMRYMIREVTGLPGPHPDPRPLRRAARSPITPDGEPGRDLEGSAPGAVVAP